MLVPAVVLDAAVAVIQTDEDGCRAADAGALVEVLILSYPTDRARRNVTRGIVNHLDVPDGRIRCATGRGNARQLTSARSAVRKTDMRRLVFTVPSLKLTFR